MAITNFFTLFPFLRVATVRAFLTVGSLLPEKAHGQSRGD